MQPNATRAVGKPAGATDREQSIRHLPAEAREAFQRFQSVGDPVALDRVVFAILEDFIPKAASHPLAELPGNTRLVDDLGFDSLAITEVVFFIEDLFGIAIANHEIVLVRSLDDLRRFVRTKVAACAKG